MSTAAAIFTPNAPLPAAGASSTGAAPDAQGEGVFAGLLNAATAEAPSQSATGFLKTPPQVAPAKTGAQPAAVAFVVDAPVAQVKDVVEAVIVAEGVATDSEDTDAGSTAEAAPAEPAADASVAPVASQPLPIPTPVAVVPQAAAKGGAAEPAQQDPTAPAMLPVANDAEVAPAAEPMIAQPASVEAPADAGLVATPAPAAPTDAVATSTKAAEAIAQTQIKDVPGSQPEQPEAPVAPALKAEARTDRSSVEPSAPAGAAMAATTDASTTAASTPPAQAKDAATDTSSAKAPAKQSTDLSALDAPADAAPSPDVDNLTAATPAAAREAAQPQTTPAALASSLSRATVETTAQMSAQILRRLEGRSTHFDMVLTPEALGRVEVSVDIDADGQLAARLAFDNPAAALDLRGRADELRRQLEDAGFRLTDDSLSFTDRDSGRSGDQRQDGAAHRFASAARVANDADQIVPAPRWMSMNLTRDRVDVRV